MQALSHTALECFICGSQMGLSGRLLLLVWTLVISRIQSTIRSS
jgi:hypothetical protein